MGRSVSPLLRRELANLEKDPTSRRSAMKTLRCYVKDLDSKAIPHFLAQVSESKASSPGECTISLYEVLARVHGRNIVPQIDNIMSTIVRTLSSRAGSFPLHQACSKVVPAIARYGIDPSTPAIEKTRIICCLCEPLCGPLVGPREGAASGAALCLKALVESDNWKFASSDTVNEVCLKAAGALEGRATQSNCHMGLVMALAKHNGSIAEAYAGSLVRSGIRILTAGVAESNSQKRLSAVQMIDFLIKSVDTRSISSELSAVINAMEKCQGDEMPFVRNAALETLETAKMLSTRKGSKQQGTCPGPNMGLRFETDGNKWGESFVESPESQTMDPLFEQELFVESPTSAEHPSFKLEHRLRTNRCLWGNNLSGVDVLWKDELFLRDRDNSTGELEQRSSDELTDGHQERLEQFDGFVESCGSNNNTARSTTPSPQRSRPHLTVNGVNIYTTPRKLMRSLQDPVDDDSKNVASPTLAKTIRSPTMELNEDRHSCNQMKIIGDWKGVEDAKLTADDDESVSSTQDLSVNKKGVSVESGRGAKYGRASVCLLCVLCLFFSCNCSLGDEYR